MKEFVESFYNASKAKRSAIPRIDELPYYITWPLVYVLKQGNVKPVWLSVISFLGGVLFLFTLVWKPEALNPLIPSLLLLIRILLDYADGQLARYAFQTSNLGALYDLIADFFFVFLLYISIAWVVIVAEELPLWVTISLTITAFISHLTTATVSSFLNRLASDKAHTQQEIAMEFVRVFPNDFPEEPRYSKKLSVMNSLFLFTWRVISIYVLAILVGNRQIKYRQFSAHLSAFFEYSIHLFVLLFIVFLGHSFLYFLAFEILALATCVALLLFLRIISFK